MYLPGTGFWNGCLGSRQNVYIAGLKYLGFKLKRKRVDHGTTIHGRGLSYAEDNEQIPTECSSLHVIAWQEQRNYFLHVFLSPRRFAE